jgi:hypothetical protein
VGEIKNTQENGSIGKGIMEKSIEIGEYKMIYNNFIIRK